mgnify:CR=1 FL=1
MDNSYTGILFHIYFCFQKREGYEFQYRIVQIRIPNYGRFKHGTVMGQTGIEYGHIPHAYTRNI